MEEKKIDEKQAGPDAPMYMAEALFLAESYTQMLKFRDALKKRLAGSWVYTIDMAISDLDSITVSYESERVQSSNISKPTERIALKLTDEYLARKQTEMDAEKAAIVRELDYVSWKIEVAETVWKERAKGLEKSLFQLLFYQHKTYREAEEILLRKKNMRLQDCSIAAIKTKIWMLFEKEIEFRYQDEEERHFVEMLAAETGRENSA
ncbi:MAG: hypothetical protein IJQ88_11710 [Clostridia bacterium]|nr:hypothetical protein [Clostridia bacterium]MBQ6722820.1 hypothetical protein [Clostridia bacterium]